MACHKTGWRGRVWLNPPYGATVIAPWMEKMAQHGDGIALVFARTDTAWFQQWVFDRVSALLFVEGRLRFHHINGAQSKNAVGAPSVLVAYGDRNAEALRRSGLKGRFVPLPDRLTSWRRRAA